MNKRIKSRHDIKVIKQNKNRLGTLLDELRMSESESIPEMAERLGYSKSFIDKCMINEFSCGLNLYLSILQNYDLTNHQVKILHDIYADKCKIKELDKIIKVTDKFNDLEFKDICKCNEEHKKNIEKLNSYYDRASYSLFRKTESKIKEIKNNTNKKIAMKTDEIKENKQEWENRWKKELEYYLEQKKKKSA